MNEGCFEGAVIVRDAALPDAGAISGLLQELGYSVSAAETEDRLGSLAATSTDPVLVATVDGVPVGLIALHWTHMLVHADRVARVTALVTHGGARQRGIGRRLIAAGADRARQAGCDLLELTTALQRSDAHAFYRSLGFEASSYRFFKPLP